MPLANLDMGLDTYFTLVQRVNQLVQVTNEEQTKGFSSNGNVAVHGSVTANGNLRVAEANVTSNLVVYKSATIRASDGQVVALNVASGLVKGDGGLLSNIRSANLTTNNFLVQSNNSTVTIGGSAELGKTLFLSVRTVTDLADNASGNVASTQLANVLDLHIKTVHAIQNTIVSTDLPGKQTVNTNLHQLANVGPMSNGDILVFANNRLERLPLGVANQTLIVQNNRLEFSNALTTTVVEYFFSSGFWNKPANFKEAIIYAVGAGGGGGGGRMSPTAETISGVGGGGGQVAILYANNSELASNVTVTIGTGGAGGNGYVIVSQAQGGVGYINSTPSYSGGTGSAGGSTTFGAYLTALGGSGGGTVSGPPGGGTIPRSGINRTRTERTFFGGSGGATTSGVTTLTSTLSNVDAAVIVFGGGASYCDDFTAGNNSYDGSHQTLYYGAVESGDSITAPETTKNGGNLVNGVDGTAYGFHNIFISFGGQSGYPQYRSVGANGGNGILGSGGAAGASPTGWFSNAVLNTAGSIHTGYGGLGGNGYVVVISTIGRS